MKPEAPIAIKFAINVKKEHTDIPILLLSKMQENESDAKDAGASFIIKDSPLLLNELRQFMNYYFSFGDFIFRTHDGIEVGRATDLVSLEKQLKTVNTTTIFIISRILYYLPYCFRSNLIQKRIDTIHN